ncbi:flippase, partial [Neobacillus niacini]|uniref:flippase n=1 Tax=Neobacillus niacini TaxID=86668 RepID=UPI002FFFDF41
MASLKKNLIYQSAYQIIVILLPLITAPYISRVLGAEGIGIYSYTFSVANYFVLFSMLGLNNYGNRQIAIVRDNKTKLNQTFSNIFALHFLISTLVLVAYISYVLIFVQENKIYAMIAFMYIVAAMFDINWFFFGIENFKITVTRNIIIKILTASCIFYFVKESNDLWLYIAIMGIGTFISQSLVWIVVKRYVRFVKPAWADMKEHMKPLLVLFIPVLAVSLYKIMSKIMLGNMTDSIQVGLYENSEKIVNIPMGLITAVGVVMLPRMSNISATLDFNRAESYIMKSMQYVMIAACAWSFGIGAIAPEFAPIFFGEEFKASGVLMQGLAITIPFIAFANVIRTQFLIPNKYDHIYVKSVVLGAIVNIICNLIFIPKMLAVGAVIGTVLAEITVCLYQSIAVRNKIQIYQYLKKSIYFIILGLCMAGIVRIIGSTMEASIVSITIEITLGILLF